MSAMRKPRTNILQFEEHKEFGIRNMTILPDLIQTRDKVVDPKWSREYAKRKEQGSPFPAVTLFYDTSTSPPRYLLADGHTRVDAAKQLGLTTIPVVVRHGGITEAMLYGIEANLSEMNMREVTYSDRKRSVEMMIKNREPDGGGTWNWSDTAIGCKCVISATVVKKIRLDLCQFEGVPLPERVLVFSGGVNHGETRPYRNLSNGIPSLNTKPYQPIRAYVDGVKVYLGKDEQNAQQQLLEIAAANALKRGVLRTHGDFRQWLTTHFIQHHAVKQSESSLGGTTIGNAVICPSAQTDTESLLGAGMRVVAHSTRIPFLVRRIVVAWRAENPKAGAVIRELRESGIEVMTPDEFLAEFAPQSDAANDADSATV